METYIALALVLAIVTAKKYRVLLKREFVEELIETSRLQVMRVARPGESEI